MKSVIVTGVSSGIGLALVKALLLEGYEVLGISRRTPEIAHVNFRHVAGDLSDLDTIEQIALSPLKGSEIYLINNAGSLGGSSHLNEKSGAEIEKAFRLNVTAPMVLCKRVMNLYGHKVKQLITISSGAAEAVIDGWTTYCASKAAVNQFSRVYQKELAMEGYDTEVMAIGPGVVDTEMQGEIRNAKEAGFSQVQNFIQMKEDGVLKSPETIANLLLKLMDKRISAPDVYFSLRDFYEDK